MMNNSILKKDKKVEVILSHIRLLFETKTLEVIFPIHEFNVKRNYNYKFSHNDDKSNNIKVLYTLTTEKKRLKVI